MEPRLFSHGYDDCVNVVVFHHAYLQWSHGFSAMDTAGNQGYLYNTIPARLRFQGSTFLSSYVCQCLPHNSMIFTAKCARAIPSMCVAPDLSHYERNQASLHTLPQSTQTTKASLCLGFV